MKDLYIETAKILFNNDQPDLGQRNSAKIRILSNFTDEQLMDSNIDLYGLFEDFLKSNTFNTKKDVEAFENYIQEEGKINESN